VLAAVHFEDLLRVVIAATVAGVGVTAIYSLALLGVARTIDAHRSGRPSGGWPVLAVVAGLGVLASAALGVYAVAAL
jgi:hypothetical protein